MSRGYALRSPAVHRVFAVALVVCCATSAFAQAPPPDPAPGPAVVNQPPTPEVHVPWYRGPYGKNRVFHLSLTVGLGLAFLVSETVAKDASPSPTVRLKWNTRFLPYGPRYQGTWTSGVGG